LVLKIFFHAFYSKNINIYRQMWFLNTVVRKLFWFFKIQNNHILNNILFLIIQIDILLLKCEQFEYLIQMIEIIQGTGKTLLFPKVVKWKREPIHCPPSFPVLTLINYYLCGYLKNVIYPLLPIFTRPPQSHKH